MTARRRDTRPSAGPHLPVGDMSVRSGSPMSCKLLDSRTEPLVGSGLPDEDETSPPEFLLVVLNEETVRL
jgi:hypothetical protein